MRDIACICLLASLFVMSCSNKLKVYQYNDEKAKSSLVIKTKQEGWKTPCRDYRNYLPDTIHKDWQQIKRVRIAWHMVDDSKWENNFTSEKGNQYFYNLTNNANERIAENFKMALPLGNNTPAYDPMFRWVITTSAGYGNTGYHYHTDDSIVYFNNKGRQRTDYSTKEIEKFAISKDTISNIFVIPVHPDSMKSKTFSLKGAGIALGNHVKVGGLFQSNNEDWKYATLLNHELGHVFGLSHSWYEDGCDDTPTHPNCWGHTEKPPCDKNVSNNVMDYNNSQMAWSPCQIGKVHLRMSDTLSTQRKLVIKDWCKLDTSSNIVIADSIDWLGYRDVNKSIIIEKGGRLKVCCRLGMTKDSYIYIKPGGKLILEEVTLHNDCGHSWQGIFVGNFGNESGKLEKVGRVDIFDSREDTNFLEQLNYNSSN